MLLWIEVLVSSVHDLKSISITSLSYGRESNVVVMLT